MRLVIITFCSFILASCGNQGVGTNSQAAGPAVEESDENPNRQSADNEEEYASTVLLQTEDNLPSCNYETEGQLAYIVNTEQLKTCDSETWVDISIGGEATDEMVGLVH